MLTFLLVDDMSAFFCFLQKNTPEWNILGCLTSPNWQESYSFRYSCGGIPLSNSSKEDFGIRYRPLGKRTTPSIFPDAAHACTERRETLGSSSAASPEVSHTSSLVCSASPVVMSVILHPLQLASITRLAHSARSARIAPFALFVYSRFYLGP